LHRADRDELESEGNRLLDFVAGPNTGHDVEFTTPGYRASWSLPPPTESK
jgi:hypothetical protein